MNRDVEGGRKRGAGQRAALDGLVSLARAALAGARVASVALAEATRVLELAAEPVARRFEQRRRERSARSRVDGNVTSREAELLASNLRFRALFDAMAEGVVLHDRTGAVIQTNAAAQRILDVDRDALAQRSAHGPPLAPLIRRDGSPMPDAERPAAQLLRTGEPVRGQVMGLTRAGGPTTWISITGAALRESPDEPPSGAVIAFRDITEEVVLQEALEKSLGDFGTLVASLPVGIALSHGRTMRYVNEALVRILGYDAASELEGRATTDIIHSRSAAALAERYASMTDGRHPGPGILECRRRDGSPVLVEVTSIPSVYEGRPAILAIVRDVTESTRARSALELSELRFRALVDFAPVGIFETDLEGQCVYANEQACRLVGLPLGQVVGEGWMSRLHPDDRTALAVARQHAREARSGLRHEVRYVHPDKTVFVRVKAVPLLVDGKVSGFLGAIVDLTALHAAQEALAKSEASFRQLAERAPIGLTVRVGSTIVFVNPAMVRIHGFESAEAFIGHDPTTLIAPSSRQALQARMDATARGQAVAAEVFTFRRPSGEEIRLEVDSISVEFRGIPAIMSLIRDVTELERAQAERDKANLALVESLVQKETLLKEVHHRVKNNLQVIMSLLRLGRGYVTDSGALAIFNDSIARLHSIALIHEQLYQSRDLGRIDMHRYLSDLVTELVRAHTTQHRVAAQVRAEKIFFNIDRCVPIGLIVNELVNNALKHAFDLSGPAPATLEIALTDTGHSYELIVRDNGIGIDPLKVRDNSLGLRLVSSLARQLRGRHRYEVEGGTRWHITFPKEVE